MLTSVAGERSFLGKGQGAAGGCFCTLLLHRHSSLPCLHVLKLRLPSMATHALLQLCGVAACPHARMRARL